LYTQNRDECGVKETLRQKCDENINNTCDNDKNRGDLVVSHRSIVAAAEVALSEGRPGQPEGRSRESPSHQSVQVGADLPSKKS